MAKMTMQDLKDLIYQVKDKFPDVDLEDVEIVIRDPGGDIYDFVPTIAGKVDGTFKMFLLANHNLGTDQELERGLEEVQKQAKRRQSTKANKLS